MSKGLTGIATKHLRLLRTFAAASEGVRLDSKRYPLKHIADLIGQRLVQLEEGAVRITPKGRYFLAGAKVSADGVARMSWAQLEEGGFGYGGTRDPEAGGNGQAEGTA